MKVFVSYCGDGKELAERLTDTMAQSSIDAWTYSDPNYTNGDYAWMEICREIQAREWMIVLTTECTATSTSQLNECMHALRYGGQPFSFSKLGVETLDVLKSRNMGHFEENNFDDSCKKLIEDLKKEEELRQLVTQQRVDAKHAGIVTNIDKLKALIRQGTEGLPTAKVKESRGMIIDRYLQRTIIRDITSIGFVFDADDLQGEYVLIQDDAEQFKHENVDYRLICSDIADAIVTGERGYLRQFLLAGITSKKTLSASALSKSDFSLIEREIDSLYSKGYTPSIILAPIQVFQPFVGFFDKRINWPAGEREQLILEGRLPLTIYWSHKGLPSPEFIILDKSSVRWTVKPDEEDGALATAIGSPLYKDKVIFFAQTLFKVELLKPEAICAIDLPEQVVGQQAPTDSETD